jgi:hypothetical protein
MSMTEDDNKPKHSVMRLPVPAHLDPPTTRGSLFTKVQDRFLSLYNDSKDDTFKEFLVAVGNKDAITKNLVFDRHNAVVMIREAAKKADDQILSMAADGDIYKCMVRVMRKNNLGLKLRREQMKQLTHQQ